MNQQLLPTSPSMFFKNWMNAATIKTMRKGSILLFLLLCFFPFLHAQINLDSCLVAYYPFNGNANDESGNGNNGVINGATLIPDRFGITNQAYKFDGINDFIEIKSSNTLTSIEQKNSVTITAWINIKGWYNNWNCFNIVNMYSKSTDYGWEFQVNRLEPAGIYLMTSKGIYSSYSWIPNFDEWYFVAVTYDKNDKQISFYINDKLVNKKSFSSSFETTGGGSLFIGCSPYGPDEYSNGIIDDIRIYNRSLNEDEIKYLYHVLPHNNGIYKVTPKIAISNDKFTNIEIAAYPITNDTKVKLINKDNTIIPDSIFEKTDYSLKARFSWNNHATGLYDMILINQTNDTLKLKNCFSLLSNGVEPEDTDGDGFRNISKFSNLVWMFENEGSRTLNYELDNDINASESELWYEGKGFNPIANFTGIIDGQGNKIKHLYFNRPNEDNVALVTKLGQTGIIRNLAITSCNIIGGNNLAAFVGNNEGGSISNCFCTGRISGKENIGGIVGHNGGLIKFCYNSALIDGADFIGGLVGNSNTNSIISQSYNIGKIVGSVHDIGGIIGSNHGKIIDCYNAGSVIGAGEVAGISGWNYGTITNTYNKGNINGTGIYCGAIIGFQSGSITNSFWDKENSGLTTSNGGTAKTPTEMKIQSTYANWDFENTWEILPTINDGYPQLSWAETTSLIKSYSPERVANSGGATVTFEGINFDSNTKVYLYKAGQDTLKADTIYTSDTYCSAKFNFNNAALGSWNILVEYPDTTVTIKNGLTVEDAKTGKLNIEILGADQFRKGRGTTVTVKVTNTGNFIKKDACIVIALDSDDPDFSAYFEGYNSVDKDIFDSLGFDVREFYFMKSENRLGHDRVCKVGIFYLPVLSAYDMCQLEVSIKSNGDYTFSAWESDYPIDVFAEDAISIVYTGGEEYTYGNSTSKSKKVLSSESVDYCESIYSKCYNDWMTDVNNTLLEEGKEELCGQLLDLIPIEAAKTIATAGYDLVNLYKEMNEARLTGDTDGLIEAAGATVESDVQGSIFSYIQEVLLNICANKEVIKAINDGTIDKLVSSGSAANRSAAKKAIRENALKSLSKVSKGAEIAGYLLSYGGVWVLRAIQAKEACYSPVLKDCVMPSDAAKFNATARGSFDPNDKYGYRSPSGSKYFNEDKINFTYVIEFENKETATAAAQEVFITDTLDTKVFDIQSFKAGSIKIGKKSYEASINARDAKWTIDMRPAMNYITYVTLKLDTVNVVAKWYFKSVDPATLDWPTDPTAGFLPPNDSTGRGQGSVSFTIDLKKGLLDETEINNKATIVFDTNEPIVTPTWSNKKDIVAPTSSMFEPDIVGDNKALISWDGKDNKNGSGLYCYNLYVKKGNENYSPLLQRSALSSIDFDFEKDVKYSFYVTAIDSAENVEIKTNVPEINLEIIEDFAISKKWDDVLVCNNTGSKYTSYQWYKNGNPIQGANEQFYQEIGGLNGSYFVMVTTTDGKIGISNVIDVGSSTKSVKVYPNPLDETKEYTVEIKVKESELSSGEMIVTNVNGQIISRRKQLQPLMKLDGLVRGVYLINVQFTNYESFNEKLIVK